MSTVNRTSLFPSLNSVGNAISNFGDSLGDASSVLTIVRHPLHLIDIVTEGGSIATLFGIISGSPLLITEAIGGGMLALSGLISTGKQLLQIYKNWGKENCRSLALRIFVYLPSAMTTTAIGLALTIQKAASLSGTMGLAYGAASAIKFLAPIQSVFHLISASYNIYTTGQLSDSLSEYQKSLEAGKRSSKRNLSREEACKKRKRQFKYLHNYITSDSEKFAHKTSQECLKKVQDFFQDSSNFDHYSKNELNNLFREVQIARKQANMIGKIRESVNKTPSEFARQTSKNCLREARQFFASDGRFLEENQKAFLHTVYKENHHAKIRSRILLVVALIGLAACFVSIFATGGAALPLISLLSGLLWIMADSKHLTDKICNWFWKQNQFDILPKDLQTGDSSQKKGELEFALKTTGLILTAPIWLVPAFMFYEIKSLYHRISDKITDLKWRRAGWLPGDAEKFENQIGSLKISANKAEDNPYHFSTYFEKGLKETLEEFKNSLQLDSARGHSIFIRQNDSDKPGSRVPPENPNDRFSAEERTKIGPGITLQKEFFEEMKRLGFSLEDLSDPNLTDEKRNAILAILTSGTQSFFNQAYAICELKPLFSTLKNIFPVYKVQEEIKRKGNAEEKMDQKFFTQILKEGEHCPVIINLEKRISTGTMVLCYTAIDPDKGKVPLMHLKIEVEMKWDTGEIIISGIEPLTIFNFKTQSLELLKRPDILLRSDDWEFPPHSSNTNL